MLGCAFRGIKLPRRTAPLQSLRRPFCTQKYNKTNWLALEQEIKDCTYRGQFNEAFKLFQDVRRRTGGKPPIYCYEAITSCLFAAQAAQNSEDYTVDVEGWNTLIDCHAKDDWLNAVQLPMVMMDNDIQPNVTTFNNLIDAMVINGDFRMGERIFLSMQTLQVNPDIETFNPLIKYHLTHPGETKSVLNIFDRMKLEKIAPNNRTGMIMEKYYGHKKHRPVYQAFYKLLEHLGTTLMDPLPEMEDDDWTDHYDHLPPPAFDEEGRPIIPKEFIHAELGEDYKFPVVPEVLEWRKEQQEEVGPKKSPSVIINFMNEVEEELSSPDEDDDMDFETLKNKVLNVTREQLENASIEEMKELAKLIRRYAHRDIELPDEFWKKANEGYIQMQEHQEKLRKEKYDLDEATIESQMPEEMRSAKKIADELFEAKRKKAEEAQETKAVNEGDDEYDIPSELFNSPEEEQEAREGWNKWYTGERNPTFPLEPYEFDAEEVMSTPEKWEKFQADFIKGEQEENAKIEYLYQQYLDDNADMLAGKTQKPPIPGDTGEKFYPLTGGFEEEEPELPNSNTTKE